MLKTTAPFLRCVNGKKCKGELALVASPDERDIQFGSLQCKTCKTEYPILAGVAIVVPDVHAYLVYHVKGISKFVPDAKIPKPFRADFVRAKKEIPEELTEEDLESDRVNALYLMNHYLEVKGTKDSWWKPLQGKGSQEIEYLVEKYWDSGPLQVISAMANETPAQSVVELGCGVGGLFRKLGPAVKIFIGLDSSFQSILLARHFNLGSDYAGNLKIPEDLLQGSVSREVKFIATKVEKSQAVDFIVGEIDRVPLALGTWDAVISMNTIDMLDDPRLLPDVQAKLLKQGGFALQSDPYIWHEKIARRLRSQLPKSADDSAKAIAHLYEKAGFKIEKAQDQIPWIFFKHLRQIEFYSVHAFLARKL